MAKKRILFLTDYFLTPFQKIMSGGILCEQDKILAVGGASAFSEDEEKMETVDMAGTYAMPGFIDSHIHGIGTIDTGNAGDAEFHLEEMGIRLARHGVTTFLPTLVSRPGDRFLRAISTISDEIEKHARTINVPGIHLEGPFINPLKRGSQRAEDLMSIDEGFLRELLETGKGRIKMMTFAPELENSVRLVEILLENGVIPSMGHSMAAEAEALRCIDAGASRCTYVFNGMPTFNHKQSTLTDVVLTDDRVSVEMIVDGYHVHPRIVDLVTRCKPKDKIIGISNSVGAPETENGSPEEQKFEIVKDQNGIVKGSTLTLESSWFHLMNYAKMDQALAAACFTSNPAADLGLVTRGELKPGKRADLVFFDAKTNKVRMTVSRGQIIYRKETAES